MAEAEATEGDILVYAKVRDPYARVRLRQLLDDLPGERINGSIYEVFTADWDPGLWDEEVQRMQELVDPATDTLILWCVANGRLVRTSLCGRSS